MQRGQTVLVDTNIMIEAVRVNGWNALKAHFQIVTVDKCCEEARSGDLHRPGYVQIKESELRDRLESHAVSDLELITLSLACAEAAGLDDGERHLWAHALAVRVPGWRQPQTRRLSSWHAG